MLLLYFSAKKPKKSRSKMRKDSSFLFPCTVKQKDVTSYYCQVWRKTVNNYKIHEWHTITSSHNFHCWTKILHLILWLKVGFCALGKQKFQRAEARGSHLSLHSRDQKLRKLQLHYFCTLTTPWKGVLPYTN